MRRLQRCARGAGAGTLAVLGMLAGEPAARAEDPWSLHKYQTDPGPSTAEEREERARARNALAERFESVAQSSVPLVSEQTIAATEAAIDRYQRMAGDAGEWWTIPDGTTIRPGDSGNSVGLVKSKLLVLGDLSPEAAEIAGFEQGLADALGRFQARHGLRVTGFVDQATRKALNISPRDRARQLETNLARIRGLAGITTADRYVLVNVPGFTLQAVKGGQLGLESRVVAGKPARETPEVSARILELNFFPFWRVPDSIAGKDVIPKLRQDPGYLTQEHFSVLSGWGAAPLDPAGIDWGQATAARFKFRQDPGPWNALGLVRINMPNKHDVYLHDTPLKALFGQSARAFSSGCVRVQRVFDLADWLLQDEPGWDPSRVQEILDRGQAETLKLRKPVPVHFAYLTAWANERGIVQFRTDIYGKDGSPQTADEEAGATVAEQRAITP